MTSEIIFYTNPMSRGRIVRWMLEELQVPYRTELLDYGPTMKSAEYLAINPMGKVPAIRHGETIVTESPAICALSRRRLPRCRVGAAGGASGRLLPLAVLRRRST